ncbi:YoaK family protein [Vibrio aphrogenes]|uniref:YoaK family protein n=1 Tax=Vibrio aphrogenes TaxID=1891186 RepID=UPI000B363670|nr:YoaK family protein [Vibrio aphrogenes]
MFTKLPRWVEYGTFTLAFIAGFVNAIGLLGFEHQAISHLSGSVTLVGIHFFQSPLQAWFLIGLVTSFVLGSAISGVLIFGESLKLGRHYDSVLLLEATLLFICAFLLEEHISVGLFLASMACGLQNALVTTYSGAVIRTTHLTGLFTDLGIMLGRKVSGYPLNRRKFVMFFVIITGFICGAFVAKVMFDRFSVMALFFPASCCLVLALGYRIYRQTQKRHSL